MSDTCPNCGSGIYKIEEASTEYHFPGDPGHELPEVTEYSCGRVHVEDHGGDVEVFASAACNLIRSLREELATAQRIAVEQCMDAKEFMERFEAVTGHGQRARDAERDLFITLVERRRETMKAAAAGHIARGYDRAYADLLTALRNNEHRKGDQ